MFPGLPRVFPNGEWKKYDDVFRDAISHTGAGNANTNPEEAWVKQELEYYEASFTSIEDLNVSVTTFNVGCKKPQLPLNGLIQLTAVDGQPIDLVVVALQEVDMSASAMFKEETEAAVPWIQALQSTVGADMNTSGTSPYFAFPPKQLVGLLLCVFVRRALLSRVKEYTITTVATGAMGSMGNKGAVGLHVVLHRTSICIITAHLAAGQNNVSKRNNDINTILKSMDFNANRRADVQMNVRAGIIPELQFPELFPRNHDLIVVAGDLNYRLNTSYEKAIQLIQQGNFGELLLCDQLKAELANPHTPWQGFMDFTPTFAPTYRFDIGTNVYDTSEKHRVPSYTDRVCVWSKRKSLESRVQLDRFTALTDISSSDHKPVQAVLRLPVCVEVPSSKEEVTRSLRTKVSSVGLEIASSAVTVCEEESLDFGLQQFHNCGTRRVVTVSNKGDCVAVVRAVRLQADDVSEGAWLRVQPLDFSILPGESQEVVIETQINPRCMPWVRRWHPFDGRGRIALNSKLAFCVRNGNTHFLECRGILAPSVFGNSLENMALLGKTPCEAAYQQKKDLQVLTAELRSQLPKEVWYLVDALSRHPLEPGLFTQSPDEEACHVVMAHIDQHAEKLPANADPHVVGECLLQFLRNLQEPVVPFALYNLALEAGRQRGKAPLLFLRQLPLFYSNVWVYIMSFLNYLLRPAHTRSNELTPGFLAQVFSSALLIRPTEAQGVSNARLLQGGGVDQQVRQQLQQEKEDAMTLVEYFLTTPPALLL